MNLHSTQIGGTLHIYDDENAKQVDAAIERRMLRTGEARIDGGNKEWIEDHELIDGSKEGADQYTWDRSGNLVKCKRVRVRLDVNGERSEKFVQFVYKSL